MLKYDASFGGLGCGPTRATGCRRDASVTYCRSSEILDRREVEYSNLERPQHVGSSLEVALPWRSGWLGMRCSGWPRGH